MERLKLIDINLIYEIQNLLMKSMPLKNSREYKALKIVDRIIDEVD